MISQDDVPTAEMQVRLLDSIIRKMVEAGYVYIGMDHFALPRRTLVSARERNFTAKLSGLFNLPAD